jgi:hypothetical protein
VKKTAKLIAYIAAFSAVLAASAATGCVTQTVAYESRNITIINQSGQAINALNAGDIKSVLPGEEVTGPFSGPEIELIFKNAKGEIIYDETFNYAQLEEMKYRIIIPAPGANTPPPSE